MNAQPLESGPKLFHLLRENVQETLGEDPLDRVVSIEYGKRKEAKFSDGSSIIEPLEDFDTDWFWGVYLRLKEDSGEYCRWCVDIAATVPESDLLRLLRGLQREIDAPVISD